MANLGKVNRRNQTDVAGSNNTDCPESDITYEPTPLLREEFAVKKLMAFRNIGKVESIPSR